ncbi:unnamed protein product [Adineta ricciae]|uniref:G domain-containing protein n=1 Tax=Adineta ricciae TaxID=249248 RepID=A0A814U0Y3_ADIRI|nr:unnamed protein product [Adineta ricciae]CAF1168442.1 unnamed protein product [Adineta ricciae]
MTTTASNSPINDRCITCLSSFGIQVERVPCKCINIKCGRQFCAQCINQIQAYNGNERPFRCMYCLQDYPNNSLPEENQPLIVQLWNEIRMKYNIKHTQNLLLNSCHWSDLSNDIDCRRRHLMNLITLYKRFCGRTQYLFTAENFVNQLTELFHSLNENSDNHLQKCKDMYQQLISAIVVNENDIGVMYINLCERLQLDISEAEYCSMFPKINTKMNEWLHEQDSTKEFQSKILDLFQAMEQDLINQWRNPYLATRTKIGVIGFTGVGKSSLINYLLGIRCFANDDAAPVSTTRSTYFPLQFDKQEPLLSPYDPQKKTLVTFIDIPGVDKDNYSLKDVGDEDDVYLDEIRKADCDVYILVYNEALHIQEEDWISYIEECLKRQCVLVRSKVDTTCVTTSNIDIEQLRLKNRMKSQPNFLVACDPSSDVYDMMSFDMPLLMKELGHLAYDTCSNRIHALAHRTIARAINIIFRRGYVLNVMRYKIAAGFASIIPFGDQLPRYLSRENIRDVFGINNNLWQYLAPFHLIVRNYQLQTSAYKEYVEVQHIQTNSKFDSKWVGRTAGAALIVGGGLADDILRVAAPAATVLSGAARTVFTVATIGIGAVISAGVSAWSAVDSGKHIFSYINRVCDDTIMIADPLIATIIERERENTFGQN